MVGGSFYYNADRLKRKEYTDLMAKRKAQEKRDAWLRELEARDQEDKVWREKLWMVRDCQRVEREQEPLKVKVKDKQDEESKKEVAELELKKEQLKEKRQEREKKQEAERMKQVMVKLYAGMGPDTRVWGEDGGGLFGWKRIRDVFNRPYDDVKDEEAKKETAEPEQRKGLVKSENTRVWSEGGVPFGKRIMDLFNRPRGGEGGG